MSNISNWSSKDDNNNRVPPDGWPEHQSPSSVNNSARAMMGGIRRAYLEQPYFNPGGIVTYVGPGAFSVADNSEITDFSQFYKEGRRIKAVSVNGVQYGNIGSVTYAGGAVTVKCAFDGGEALDPMVTEVYCGLAQEDAGEVIGRLPVGMILPYTAMSLPPGFLYADGKAFDPSIYTGLAAIWKTGENTYLYGQEVVGGVYWPKTPDVRGQFPRYLDMGAEVDPEADREIGSVQEDAIRNIEGTAIFGNNSGSNSIAIAEATGVLSAVGSRNSDRWGNGNASGKAYQLKFDASDVVPTAEENRPTNIAFPALIVAWHGITPADNITMQDVLTAFNQMQDAVNLINEAKEEALESFETQAQTIVASSISDVDNGATNAVNTVEQAANAAVSTVNNTTTTAVAAINTTKNTAISELDAKKVEVVASGDAQVARVIAEGTTQTARATTQADRATTQADRAAAQATIATAQANRAKDYADASQTKMDQIGEAGSQEIARVKAEGTTQVNRVVSEGTTQVGRVVSEGTTQVNRVISEGTTQGTAQANRVISEGNTQISRVIAEGDTQTARASAQADRATTQANLAKGYADSINTSELANNDFSNTDMADFITDTWSASNGLSHYRKWNSGRIEQWGIVNTASGVPNTSVAMTLPTSFTNTNYTVTFGYVKTLNHACAELYIVNGNKTATGFGYSGGSAGSNQNLNIRQFSWYAIGE